MLPLSFFLSHPFAHPLSSLSRILSPFFLHPLSSLLFRLFTFSNSHIFLLLFSISPHARLIMSRKPKLAKEVHLCTLWNATRWPRIANEVLSEINNAACTVLKDFSRGGVFLYGPQPKCGRDWGGGCGGSRLGGLPCWANCANSRSLTSRCTLQQIQQLRNMSQLTLFEPAFSAGLRTMEGVPQLEGCCLYFWLKICVMNVTNLVFVIQTIISNVPLQDTVTSFGYCSLESYFTCGHS